MAAVPDVTVEVYLAQSATEHTAGSWGVQFATACVLYAAHRMKAFGYPGAATSATAASAASGLAGAVSSRKAGDVSEGYGGGGLGTAAVVGGKLPAADADLLTTSYGRWYLKIRDTRSVCHAGIVGAV